MPAALRHAIRGIYRSPASAATTILTLGLGIGANIGAFSTLVTLLLKALPYPEPLQLVALYETFDNTGMVTVDFFHVLNVPPGRGCVFTEADGVAEAGVMVMTDRLWRSRFASRFASDTSWP